ncbi:transposase [Paenibacillus sp. YIM B09110]|uniref:transposase n=1 Tax=Paenibacillus sp. YIM B09110 TaxID=3126102 RepID=UPI00301D41FB
MMLLSGIGLAAGALLLGWISGRSAGLRRLCDGLAVIAFFLFFVIASAAVATTITRDTVFMTEVHRVLINPVFLASGAYIGPYTLWKLASVLGLKTPKTP